MATMFNTKIAVLCSGLLLFSACATTTHKADIQKIEASKNKIFKIGIVKAADRIPSPGGDNVDKKKMALEKIPIKEVCDTLGRHYGLQINTDFDKTVKTVKEKVDEAMQGQKPAASNKPGPSLTLQFAMFSENPYWGNKEYKEPGFLELGGPTIRDADTGDMVYITYGFRLTLFKNEFYYEAIIKSDASVLIYHQGTVAVTDIPKKGLFADSEGIWDNFVQYAANVNETLMKDIREAK